jgi:hypothetical protein
MLLHQAMIGEECHHRSVERLRILDVAGMAGLSEDDMAGVRDQLRGFRSTRQCAIVLAVDDERRRAECGKLRLHVGNRQCLEHAGDRLGIEPFRRIHEAAEEIAAERRLRERRRHPVFEMAAAVGCHVFGAIALDAAVELMLGPRVAADHDDRLEPRRIVDAQHQRHLRAD